jgi:hypothetical protein
MNTDTKRLPLLANPVLILVSMAFFAGICFVAFGFLSPAPANTYASQKAEMEYVCAHTLSRQEAANPSDPGKTDLKTKKLFCASIVEKQWGR